MQTDAHGYLSTEVDSPFGGKVRFTFYTASSGVACTVDHVTVNRVAIKGRVDFKKQETTTYANAGDVVYSHTSLDRVEYDWRKGYRASDAPDGARRKFQEWVFQTAKELWTADVTSAAHASDIARDLSRAQGKVSDLEKQLAEARARVAEIEQQAATNAPYCGKSLRYSSKTCGRPANHAGECYPYPNS